jgi:hypothetical protein
MAEPAIITFFAIRMKERLLTTDTTAALENGHAARQANAKSIAHSPDIFGEPTEWTTDPD